ncbi:hypothetical protein T439DRAFT_59837 [Meredithblackwellia eburnea MCA 4105]
MENLKSSTASSAPRQLQIKSNASPSTTCSLAILNHAVILLNINDGSIHAVLTRELSTGDSTTSFINDHNTFWMKTYSENEGLMEQLLEAGWIRDTGRKRSQGYATFPLMEILLPEAERARICSSCMKSEGDVGFETPERFKRCTRCKLSYYCSKDCQGVDWDSHKYRCRLRSQGSKPS